MNQYDIFISHASEDKNTIARPLADALTTFGAKVWYDEFTLDPGDSLSRSIDKGLADSKYGLVILSPSFFAKNWPEYELRGLTAKEIGRDKVIIPIWHNVAKEDVLKYSPPLADKVALQSIQHSPDELAFQILQIIRPDLFLRFIKRSVRLLERDEVDSIVGSVQNRLEKAKDEVLISGNDCNFIISNSGYIEQALSRNVRVKVISVDPNSPAVDMLTEIDPRFPTRQQFINSMASAETVWRGLQSKYPSLFEFRYLPVLPAIGLFITDPGDSSGIVKFEIYTAKPWKPVNSRPHFVLSRDHTEWRQFFIQQWSNYWGLAYEP